MLRAFPGTEPIMELREELVVYASAALTGLICKDEKNDGESVDISPSVTCEEAWSYALDMAASAPTREEIEQLERDRGAARNPIEHLD